MTDLHAHILDLIRAGGSDNRLIVEAPRGYIVLRAARGQSQLRVDAAGGRYLPDGVRLDGQRVGRLSELDLRQRTAASTFRGTWALGSEGAAKEIAGKIDFVMRRVYDHDGPPQVRTWRSDALDFENKRLIEVMQRLSKHRTMRTRLTLYNTLLPARLALLLDAPLADPQRQDDAKLHVVEELVDTPVVAAFTDSQSLDDYDPRGRHTVLWTGRELFPLLAARQVGSLLINPGTGVRGELYRNEILTISDGIKRQSGVH